MTEHAIRGVAGERDGLLAEQGGIPDDGPFTPCLRASRMMRAHSSSSAVDEHTWSSHSLSQSQQNTT